MGEEKVVIHRLIRRDEAKELLYLLHDAYQADTVLGIHFKAATVSLAEVLQHIDEIPTFITAIDGEIVATVSVRLPWSNEPGPYVMPHLGWVATKREHAHQGYASQLIDWVEKNYLRNSLRAPQVSLGTALEHPWLSRFYQKKGFKQVEVVRKFSDHQTVYLVKNIDMKERG